ncbi:hypothetical protein Z517_04296 [Fonsecaea pedrosoi CBS 271.37]|uniref:Uncharacterized protein n=1 Tax=Fonsecaea pedrosoi CBS 271.37 TaxID=1442368 RepID=A0A0D2DU06_9EURO|nr:uncharacterized protein Z517_04296 [Fonsecaea pedrosoi CBS 271.37]KIW81271.1 hypothetical protein Z517_04296 [Fonsecaea pedrosoi CBS 271.37]
MPPPKIQAFPPPPQTPTPPPSLTPPDARWTITYSQQVPKTNKLQKPAPTKIFTGTSPVSTTNLLFTAHSIKFESSGHFSGVAYSGLRGQGEPRTLRDGGTIIGTFLSFSVSPKGLQRPQTVAGGGRGPAQGLLDFDPEEGLGDDETPEEQAQREQEEQAQHAVNQHLASVLEAQGLKPPALPRDPSDQPRFDREARQLMAAHGIPDLPPLTTQDKLNLAYEQQLLQAAIAHGGQSHGPSSSSQTAHPTSRMAHPTSPAAHPTSNIAQPISRVAQPPLHGGQGQPANLGEEEEEEEEEEDQGQYEGDEYDEEDEGGYHEDFDDMYAGPDEDGYYHAI